MKSYVVSSAFFHFIYFAIYRSCFGFSFWFAFGPQLCNLLSLRVIWYWWKVQFLFSIRCSLYPFFNILQKLVIDTIFWSTKSCGQILTEMHEDFPGYFIASAVACFFFFIDAGLKLSRFSVFCSEIFEKLRFFWISGQIFTVIWSSKSKCTASISSAPGRRAKGSNKPVTNIRYVS